MDVNFGAQKIPYLTKTMLMDKFEKLSVSDDVNIFETLADLTPLYFLRKMQLPNLMDFQRLLRLLPVLKHKDKPLEILDYGCGSADLSIFLAKGGHEIKICDVESGNLLAARKRFELRCPASDGNGILYQL